MPESVTSTTNTRPHHIPDPGGRQQRHRWQQPRPQSQQHQHHHRHRSPSPSPSTSSTCSSAASRHSTRRGHPVRSTSNRRALVRTTRPPAPPSEAGSDGPEEYTVYPDGRVREHRRRGRRDSGRRGTEKEGAYPGWGRERYGERDYRYAERGRWPGRDREDEREGRRRSKEEAKGLLIAALVFVAGVVLCWD